MKNIVENQGIKTDKAEIEGLRNQLAAVVAENAALADKCDRLEYNLGNVLTGEQDAIRRADALAAENAALKNQSPIAWHICIGNSVTTDRAEADMWRGTPLVIADIETPATDAAVAAIEARGLEKFADSEHCSQEAHACAFAYLAELEGK